MKETEKCLVKSAKEISGANGVINAIRVANDCDRRIKEEQKRESTINECLETSGFSPNTLVSQLQEDQKNDMIR